MTDPTVNPIPTDIDLNKISTMILVLRDVLIDASLNLNDNEIINTAFGVYASLMHDILKSLMDKGEEEVAGKLRDNSMEQVQHYCELILSVVPRRMVELN